MDPNARLLEPFERCRQVRLTRDPDRVGSAHRGPGRGARDAHLMVLGNDDPMDPEHVSRAEHGAEVPRVLDLVEGQKEGRLSALDRDLEQIVQIRVLGGGDSRHYALMMGRPGDRGELVTGPIGDLDAGPARQRHDLGERTGGSSQDGDLVGLPPTAFEERKYGISSEEDVAQRRGVNRGPAAVSSTDHPSLPIASRSSSERRQSRRLRASPRSLSRLSTSGGGPAMVTSRAKRPSAPPRRLSSATPATSARW